LADRILVGGATFDQSALTLCRDLQVKGVVTGSIDSATLRSFVGREITVSITGDEEVPFPLVITEGFGFLTLQPRVVDVLRPLSGKEASLSGVTQVRAGATRPEIIIPLDIADDSLHADSSRPLGLEHGARVRALRAPYFGELGRVEELISEPEVIPSGAKVRVVRVRLDAGETVTIPRANLELI
jgi:hypothetical protein